MSRKLTYPAPKVGKPPKSELDQLKDELATLKAKLDRFGGPSAAGGPVERNDRRQHRDNRPHGGRG